MAWYQSAVADIHSTIETQARAHQNQLTKPPGSLGKLEDLAVRLAAMQGKVMPSLDRIMIRVFAADHGVVAEGVSAFPQSVTVEMIRNFSAGGAAISVLAGMLDADFGVINVGTVSDMAELPLLQNRRISGGTQNFCHQAAMSAEQLEEALQIGRDVASESAQSNRQLFIGGEMGIGNTTAAAALACAVLQQPAELLAGLGTGLDQPGLRRKQQVIADAIELHRQALYPAGEFSPFESLRCLGGFEIAALVGSYIGCAQQGIPVLVDGFISSVAALLAVRLNPGTRSWLFFAHQSAEAGHARVLSALDAQPLLSLGMRLGEASGAAVAVPLMRMACQLHAKMATFDGAGVSTRQS